MKIDLKGHTAVVTGGTSGIGLATAGLFLDAGANVSICGRDQGRLDEAAATLTELHPDAALLAVTCDVLDTDSVGNLVEKTVERFGGVDTLVNNAGQARVSNYENTSDEAWREELDLKFFGLLNPSRAFQPYLERSDAAAIVCASSMLARQPEPHLVATAAARAGQLSLIHSMARELAPKNIRINSILIGVVESAQWTRRYDALPEGKPAYADYLKEQAVAKGVPLGRFGKPEEAAMALFFLGTPLSSYTTGSTIDLSGGLSRHVG
ncbi:MAG: SDR family oxidoreductase [Alphaproteobacteria bacterium]|nr:SDR family oxidoreductase [Alphaproteobacteria bacterium]